MQSLLPARSLHPAKHLFSLPAPTRQYLLASQFSKTLLRPVSTTTASTPPQPTSPVIPAPTETSGPLLQRLPNRALPTLTNSRSTWTRTLPLFLFLCTISSLAIFNYQKSSSSTVASILYALRTNPAVREILGDEIYFASKIPWISGELNPLQGSIDISFWVKGTRGKGIVKFVSVRRKREKYFETTEWSLKMEDGREVQLLDLVDAEDPIKGVELEKAV